METVINQHGLDIEALKSSRLPMASGTQAADLATTQFGGSFFVFLFFVFHGKFGGSKLLV